LLNSALYYFTMFSIFIAMCCSQFFNW